MLCLYGINFILTTLPYSKIIYLLAHLSWSVIIANNIKNHEAQINLAGFTRMALAFPKRIRVVISLSKLTYHPFNPEDLQNTYTIS